MAFLNAFTKNQYFPMNSHTKLFRQMQAFQLKLQQKFWDLRAVMVGSIFFLFLGFVVGNLFGTFLVFFREFVHWDVLIIALAIAFSEFISYLHYKNQTSSPRRTWPFTKIKKVSNNRFAWLALKATEITTLSSVDEKCFLRQFNQKKQKKIEKKVNRFFNLSPDGFPFKKLLNFYKIGLLLGFFIDAFKVGS